MSMIRTKTVTFFRPDWLSRWGKRRAGAAPPVRGREARPNLWLLGATAVIALAAACGYGGTARAGPNFKVLHSFVNLRGANPQGVLLADGAGNLYGTTLNGGRSGCGDVFELSPPAVGKEHWTETVLFSFNRHTGCHSAASLIADGAGNLYGTTLGGGARAAGRVFELSPPAPGQTAWTETVLFTFSGKNGFQPGSLIADGAGNLYGMTCEGGSNDGGVVFELTRPPAGQTAWTETVLHSFSGADGEYPYASLIADGAGNLYGTTANGGRSAKCYSGCGVVFELSPPAVGKKHWTETVLYSFDMTKGASPLTSLIADGAGNLYGTTEIGGGSTNCVIVATSGCGVVFELSPPAPGTTAWTETVLHSFDGADGGYPYAGLIADGAGNLYGTTDFGGRHTHTYGVVFELTPPAVGEKRWTETVLHSFDLTKGAGPAGLIADGAGNLYGTTDYGGAYGGGVAFRLTP